MTWVRTRAAEVGNRRLTAWAMTRPHETQYDHTIHGDLSPVSSWTRPIWQTRKTGKNKCDIRSISAILCKRTTTWRPHKYVHALSQLRPFSIWLLCSSVLKLNFVALVHKRTIPTERPPLVGEVGANLWG
jgi:hypothetical protein